MACNCVDENGSLLDKCIGQCTSKNAYIQQQQVIRAYQEDAVEKIIQDGLNLILIRINEVKTQVELEFIRGFKMGFEIGKEESNY